MHNFRLSIKFLFMFYIFKLQCTIMDSATIYNPPNNNPIQEVCQNVCESSNCKDAARNILKNMDENVNPCENFYQFACGNFVRTERIPNGGSSISTRMYAISDVIKNMYNELLEIKSSDLGSVKKLKTHFQNCLNETRNEMETMDKFFHLLKNIGGWPVLLGNNWDETNFDWREKIYKMLDANFILSFPVNLQFVLPDMTDPKKSILKINNVVTNIDETYLLNAPNNEYLTAYYNLITDVVVELGAHKQAVQEEINELVNFEINLFKISSSTKNLHNQSTELNQMTVNDLSKNYPSIPWYELLNKVLSSSGIFIDSSEIIIVDDFKFIADLEELIKVTPRRVIANYLTWQSVQNVLSYLPYKFQKILDKFSNIVKKTTETKVRAYECLKEVQESLDIPLSIMYVKNNFNQLMKNDIFDIFQNIKSEMIKYFKMIRWMDNKTRKFAIEKLQKMNITIGFNDEFMDFDKADQYYNDLVIDTGTYFESAINLTNFLNQKRYYYSRNPVENSYWKMPPFLTNAEYIYSENSINLPTAQLQRPYYQSEDPQYFNYAGIGTIIGHEISHGFDSKGRLYDKNGHNINWWQSDAEKVFLQTVQCLIDQYNNFTVAEIGINIDGVRTINENIADIGGFVAAYHAYNEWVYMNNKTEPCLPYLTYTPRQLFWIKAANDRCSKWEPEFLKNDVLTEVHSPDEARILIPFTNIKEFAQDFNCDIGSKMNPKNKCVFV